jgi:hypothetical protein
MRSRYGSNTAFLDMTLNALLGISAMFIIAFLLIREDNKKTDIPEPPLRIMVTMEWPVEGPASNVDVDLWILEGNEDSSAVGFRTPIRQGIALERDDLGHSTDRVLKKGKFVNEIIPINREVINFRRVPEEEITVNAMYYFSQDSSVHVPVKVQVYALNPFSMIYEGEHTMTKRGQEHTFVRFTMTEEGEVIDRHYRPKSIVYAAKGPVTNNWGDENRYPQAPSPAPNSNSPYN